MNPIYDVVDDLNHTSGRKCWLKMMVHRILGLTNFSEELLLRQMLYNPHKKTCKTTQKEVYL